MNFFKNIFARIWAIWGLITFIFTFLIIIGPSMISHLFREEKNGQTFFIKVSKIWMNIWLSLIGCPVRVYGKFNFQKGKKYIVVFNHNALLDIPLSAPYTPGANKTIGKASFSKVPIFLPKYPIFKPLCGFMGVVAIGLGYGVVVSLGLIAVFVGG
jgi:1-acyl-sn-glycerol-3-phosphate acyltransferase